MTCLTALAFDLQPERGPTAEEIQVLSKATEIGEAPAIGDDVRASLTSELLADEVTALFGGGGSPLLISS